MMDIDILELNKRLGNYKCAFLCGNGFSMNFDSDYGNIYDRLFISHKDLIHNAKYDVKSNEKFTRKCLDNYNSVKQYLRNISEVNLYKIFEDALIFAESINNNKQLIEDMWKEKILTKLVFGISQHDILITICDVGRNNVRSLAA